MSMECGCNYDSEGNIREFCVAHFALAEATSEIKLLDITMDKIWSKLKEGTKTDKDKIYDITDILRNGYKNR